MEFYFFRHGETDYNRKGIVQGHIDTSLNEKGRDQALVLRDKIEVLDLDIIYSSDLGRAYETAAIAASNIDVEIIKTENLRERHLGEAQGQTIDSIKDRWGIELWETFRSLGKVNMDIKYPGGESRLDLFERVESVIKLIESEGKHRKVGISTHGGVLRSYLHKFLPEGHEPIPFHNCVLYKLDSDRVVYGPL